MEGQTVLSVKRPLLMRASFWGLPCTFPPLLPHRPYIPPPPFLPSPPTPHPSLPVSLFISLCVLGFISGKISIPGLHLSNFTKYMYHRLQALQAVLVKELGFGSRVLG